MAEFELFKRYDFIFSDKSKGSAEDYLKVLQDDYDLAITKSVRKGYNDLALFLIKRYPFKDNNAGLLAAVRGKNYDMVDFFLRNGANAFSQALYLSAEVGDEKLLNLFEEKIIETKSKEAANAHLAVALYYAIAKKQYEIINLIHSKGIN